MDYIREELLRQRTVLARLLLGQSTEDAERERKEMPEMTDMTKDYPAQLTGADVFWASRRLAAGERFRPAQGDTRTVENEAWAVYSGLGEELPEAAVRRELGREWAERSSGVEETAAYYRGLHERRSVHRGKATAVISGEVVPEEHVVTETVWAAAEEVGSARELSRVFQRDARRYDGGFTLY